MAARSFSSLPRHVRPYSGCMGGAIGWPRVAPGIIFG